MSDLEITTEKEIVKWVESIGGKAPKLEDKGGRGWPDRTCFLPGGVIFLVETKTKTGAARIQQKRWIETLTRLGFVVGIARTLEDAKSMYSEAVARLSGNGQGLDAVTPICAGASRGGAIP